MIALLWRVGWLHLVRDRGALLLTFVLPVAFFSVFASVFSEFDAGRSSRVAARVVAEDDSAVGRTVAAALAAAAGLDATVTDAGGAAAALGDGRASAVVVVPRGFGAALAAGAPPPPILVTVDPSNPVARASVGGTVQQAAVLALGGLQRTPSRAEGPSVEVRAAARFARSDASTSFYAAGLGMMFVLFSLTMRAGTVIDERDNGLVARLAVAGVGVRPLCVARWLYLGSVGVVQLSVMFAWAIAVFGLRVDTLPMVAGLGVMIAASAAVAASFGLLLAELCTTRAQLTAAANTLVLVMSALGGSMVPRFLMPPALVEAGYATINAWAIDGFRKVLWYGQSPDGLVRELTVLLLGAALMMGGACLMHRLRRLR
jgi:ABC-2 type transport system permease protein